MAEVEDNKTRALYKASTGELRACTILEAPERDNFAFIKFERCRVTKWVSTHRLVPFNEELVNTNWNAGGQGTSDNEQVQNRTNDSRLLLRADDGFFREVSLLRKFGSDKLQIIHKRTHFIETVNAHKTIDFDYNLVDQPSTATGG